MSRLDMSPAAVSRRLALVAASTDLAPERRLDAKLDMSAGAVTARLREVAALVTLCQRLKRLDAPERGG